MFSFTSNHGVLFLLSCGNNECKYQICCCFQQISRMSSNSNMIVGGRPITCIWTALKLKSFFLADRYDTNIRLCCYIAFYIIAIIESISQRSWILLTYTSASNTTQQLFRRNNHSMTPALQGGALQILRKDLIDWRLFSDELPNQVMPIGDSLPNVAALLMNNNVTLNQTHSALSSTVTSDACDVYH